MSFSIPAALTPPAGGQAWLQIGAVIVPLPVAIESAEPEPAAERESAERPGRSATAPTSEPEVLIERRLRSSELALQTAEARASEAQRGSASLTTRLEELTHELEQARAALRERDAARRLAEQRAHAETARRMELQEELARVTDEHDEVRESLQQLSGMRERVHELERETARTQRRLDEAEQMAAAARTARQRAERRLASAVKASDREQQLAREQRLADGTPTGRVTSAPSAPPAPGSHGARELSLERRIVAGRASAMAALQARSVADLEPPSSPPARPVPVAPDPAGARLHSVLTVLRQELSQLRALTERERTMRIEADARVVLLERQLRASRQRSELAFEAIEQLRQELGRMYEAFRALGAPSPPSGQPIPSELSVSSGSGQSLPPLPSAPPGSWGRSAPDERQQPSPVAHEPPEPRPGEPLSTPEPPAPRSVAALDPTRLDAALSRLREADLVIEPAPPAARSAPPEIDTPAEPVVRAWLEPVFRSLARTDPLAAGRLALALLPAHRLVRFEPLEYDLVLAETGCVRVSVPGGGAPVRAVLADEPRSDEAVRFAVHGDMASLARLLASASTRRRLGAGRARIRGDRTAARCLLDLVRAPHSWRELLDAGVVLEPWLAVSIAARMIDPTWTRGHSFTIAFQAPEDSGQQTLLHVRAGRVAAVAESVLASSSATEVVAAGASVAEVLAGALEAMTDLRGPTRPLALLLSWIERAQSG